jgi:hypothetical protein
MGTATRDVTGGCEKGVGKWSEKGWEKLKTGGKESETGKNPKKWGRHQNLGIEALKVSGNSDILMVNHQKIIHNIKPTIVVV